MVSAPIAADQRIVAGQTVQRVGELAAADDVVGSVAGADERSASMPV